MNPLLIEGLKRAPELIVIARKLADRIKTGRKAAQTADRVLALEKNEALQAELVKEMARQISDLTAVIKVLNGRMTLCLVGALLALLLAAAALVRHYVP